MKIQSSPLQAKPNPVPAAGQPEGAQGGADSQPSPTDSWQVGGAVGAGLGACAGRVVFPVGTAILAGNVAEAALGPVAGWAARVVGLAGAGLAEYKWKLGRLAGGLVGGVAGAGIGKAAGALGIEPKGQMAEVTREFSLKNLPRVLRDPQNTSQKLACFKPEAVEAFQHLRPGDIVAVQGESQFGMAARLQKLVGASGDYTHTGMVTQEGKIIEIIGGAGVREEEASRWLYQEHVAVLRPHYPTQAALDKTLSELRSYLPSDDWTHPKPPEKCIRYDEKLSLKSDDEQYCTEFLYKALRKNAPELGIEPSSRLGFKFVTVDNFASNPNIETVFSTGSNFWANQVSRFV